MQQLLSRLLPWMLVLGAGCGYSTRGLYPDQYRTVAVPIFTSSTLRRDFEFQVTEEVIKRIEMRTPYKVVTGDHAETELRGHIRQHYKNPFGEDQFDNPRGGAMIVIVDVSWIDKRTGEVIQQGSRAIDLQAMESFTIDLAQSIATANDRAAEKIADHVVTLMQAPW